MRGAELQGSVAARAHRLDEAAVLVVLHDARVAVAVRHEDVALGVPADVGLAVERIRFVRAGVLAAARHQRDLLQRIGPLAEHHQDLPVGAELRDDVGALVDRPDVVVLVDAHRVRERHAVAAGAELLDERPRLIELEEARLAAAREHEDVALRVGGDADGFTHVQPRGHLHEIHRVERDFRRDSLRFSRSRHVLGERRAGRDQ